MGLSCIMIRRRRRSFTWNLNKAADLLPFKASIWRSSFSTMGPKRARWSLLVTLAGMLPVFSVEFVPPCRLSALSRRRRLPLSRCSFCLFCTSIRAVMKAFFTSFSNSSSSRRASWLISSSENSRMVASTRCSSSTSAELGIRLRPAWKIRCLTPSGLKPDYARPKLLRPTKAWTITRFLSHGGCEDAAAQVLVLPSWEQLLLEAWDSCLISSRREGSALEE